MTLGRCPLSGFCSRGTTSRESVEPTNPESIISLKVGTVALGCRGGIHGDESRRKLLHIAQKLSHGSFTTTSMIQMSSNFRCQKNSSQIMPFQVGAVTLGCGGGVHGDESRRFLKGHQARVQVRRNPVGISHLSLFLGIQPHVKSLRSSYVV